MERRAWSSATIGIPLCAASTGVFFLLLLPAARGTAAEAVGSAVAHGGAQDSRGQELYERHCSVCHGDQGAGDGRAAYLLYPAPRDFTSARFRMVSTENGVPTQADLIATIKRGMPGSAMPPWEWFAEEDLWNLADYVRTLAIDGYARDLLAEAEEAEEELDEEEARDIALERMQPGNSIVLAGPAPDNPVTMHEGARLYTSLCESCHAADGSGRDVVELFNEDGSPTTARDFTAGIFKGGTSEEDIARRILVGLPGSPMPSTPLDDPAQANILAAYVRSMIRPGAEDRVLQRRRTIRVARIEGTVPLDPEAEEWDRVEGAWVALMPLWWRDNSVEGVVVRGVHDGRRLAFRVSWRDSSSNDEMLGQETFTDSAAIELSTEQDPPLFAMGASGAPVDIALWKAAWERDLQGVRGVDARFPNMPKDPFAHALGADSELWMTARMAGNPMAKAERSTSVEDLVAQGFGTVGPPGGPTAWQAQGRWHAGFWDVVFVRDLDPPSESSNALSPGKHAFQAFAVWDGSARDRNGQKSVSVWHRLEIAR